MYLNKVVIDLPCFLFQELNETSKKLVQSETALAMQTKVSIFYFLINRLRKSAREIHVSGKCHHNSATRTANNKILLLYLVVELVKRPVVNIVCLFFFCLFFFVCL